MKYLHTMIRTNDPDASIKFYTRGLGLKLIKEQRVESGEFTLYFIGEDENGPLLELTHNWGERNYTGGDQFGHLAYQVDDIYQICEHLMSMGIIINRPPRDGHMAFVKDPNNISIELLQAGERLAVCEPWSRMENSGSW